MNNSLLLNNALSVLEPFLRYRVQAQYKSALFSSEVALYIRIPSKEQFPL
ncbi:hypothetical protein [Helicobacter sp.]|nr:hypothetical protein [Helicobacter sp.]MCI5633059.1 hypothetical protein [Helicobacter sp.]